MTSDFLMFVIWYWPSFLWLFYLLLLLKLHKFRITNYLLSIAIMVRIRFNKINIFISPGRLMNETTSRTANWFNGKRTYVFMFLCIFFLWKAVNNVDDGRLRIDSNISYAMSTWNQVYMSYESGLTLNATYIKASNDQSINRDTSYQIPAIRFR